MKRFSWILVSLMILMSGCSSVAYLQTDDNPALNLSESDASIIKVYSSNTLDKDYTIIGQVVADADAGSNADRVVSLLKDQAAKLGADAVISMQLEIDYGYWMSGIKATGTAVKYE